LFRAAVVLVLLLPVPIAVSAQSASSSSDGGDYAPISVGSVAPDFSEKDLYGRKMIALHDYRGKVVMLNFWATWCPPCKEEIPALRALQESYKDTLVIIGASVFSTNVATELAYWEYKINYPIIYGSFDLMGRYGKVSSIPTTYLIDKVGRVAARVDGSRTVEEYERMLEPLLSH